MLLNVNKVYKKTQKTENCEKIDNCGISSIEILTKPTYCKNSKGPLNQTVRFPSNFAVMDFSVSIKSR